MHRFLSALQLKPIQGQETSLNISLAIGEVDPKLNSVLFSAVRQFFTFGKLETVMFGLAGVLTGLNID